MNIADVYQHSLVIASDYRIPDPTRVWPLLEKRRSALIEMGAHHVLVYRSIREPGRVLVMIGVTSKEPVVDLMRSRVFFDYFDAVGVDDIPAVFAGEIIERLDLTGPDQDPSAPGVVISAIVSVDDAGWLTTEIRSTRARFMAAGVRKVWIFGAFDDSHEVLILQELDNEDHARAWIMQNDDAAEWMTHAGVGVYPPLFVGEFVRMMRIDAAD